MGTDIHVVLEIQLHHIWLPVYPEPSEIYTKVHRNYILFAILANVRNSWPDIITPISQPKGIPKDASKDTIKAYEEGNFDFHTPSYLTLEEINDYFIQPYNSYTNENNEQVSLSERCTDFIDAINNKMDQISLYRLPLNRIRIIFWFDN